MCFSFLSATRGLALAAAAVMMVSTPSLAGVTINGAGATFPYPIYAKWAEAYRAGHDVSLNYQAIGSGGGIAQIRAGTVDFGASDMPMKPEELQAAGLVQFPAIMGGVVPVVNLSGIQPGQLRLTGEVLADIYLGRITKWNDRRIAEINPGLQLPDKAIAVVHRSDGSGTTFLFTHYLAAVSPDWQSQVGVSTAVQWPAGIGGQGNAGVAAMTGQTDGAIGYVEYAYAQQNRMNYAQLRNKDGNFVKPEMDAFKAAATHADWSSVPDYYLILTNQPGAESWPITGASFILMRRQQRDAEKARAVLAFFDWAFANGDAMAEQLDYVPMPASVVNQIEQSWRQQIKDSSGNPVWTGKTQ